MRISRLRIRNFRNLSDLDIRLTDRAVIVGENKSGKTNLLHALRLILDPGLSDRDRHLTLEDFWDGLDPKLGETIEVWIEISDFEGDAVLRPHLVDCLVEPDPMVARLGYLFRPKPELMSPPASTADYEFVLYRADDPDSPAAPSLRRLLPMETLGALRDAERDLDAWRRSPIRPLLQGLTALLESTETLDALSELSAAQGRFKDQPALRALETRMSDRLRDMAGPHHGTSLGLGLSALRRESLLRDLRVLVDEGLRGIADASTGTANLIFMALKSLELDRLVEDGDRDHTFLAVEEPEAHLHPHVQRLVYRWLLNGQTAVEDGRRRVTPILTTHSPYIASVASVMSIVLLRRKANGSVQATSTAKSPLSPREVADLQRYVDVNRGEFYFARGLILVEGDAELFLVPAFARALGFDLDELGISVCSVAGTNFLPYVKLVGRRGLQLPLVILTDNDPASPPQQPASLERLRALLRYRVGTSQDVASFTPAQVKAGSQSLGMFANDHTLEIDLFHSGAAEVMAAVLRRETTVGPNREAKLQGWIANPDTLEVGRLLGWIEEVGKGRFAQALAADVTAEMCPAYIRLGLASLVHALA